MMIRRKRLKRISDLKEVMSRRHHRSFWESLSVISRVANNATNFCAGGAQPATSKKINEEKNRAFSDNLWWQASKLQGSCVISFLSPGPAAIREINYHRVCLTEFDNKYWALVTAKPKEQPFDSYKTERHFHKIVMDVLDQRRLGVNVFCVTELEKIYTELLLEDCI